MSQAADDDELVDPNHIVMIDEGNEFIDVVKATNGQGPNTNVVFSSGPPTPIENDVEDDVPPCDSSGQIQISMGEDD